MNDPEVTEIKPPQILREKVRREHDAALTPRSAFGGLPTDVDRAHLAELLKPETLRRNADSLPVLAAFQEFLDVERRRTRARMLALTILFLIVLIIAGGAGGLMGLSYYRKTQKKTLEVQAGLNALRAEVDASYGAFGALSNIASRTSVIKATFDKQITALTTEQDDLTSQLSGMNTNLAGLNSTIARLQNENAQLSHRMEQNSADWQMMTSQVDRIMGLLAQATPPRVQPSQTAADPATTVNVATPPQSADAPPALAARENIVLAIIPQGDVRAVDWRIPLPITQE